MSSNELLPLFPSATHPAIPIATRILSTLRTLTAPGKGNDIKPEERAALVGVAAVLGCERIQSHDLPELSAQKASSVSPAHFRSALSRSRRLLAQVDTPSVSPSKLGSGSGSGSGTGSVRTSPRKTAPTSSGPGAGGGGPTIDTLSPFSTPKKKYTYTSGIDVSDLLRSGSRSAHAHAHAHAPSTGSPLKHGHSAKGKDKEEGEDMMRTPTKKVKYTTPRGVDLATATTNTGVEETASKRPRRKDDTSAFMALRPVGGVPSPRIALTQEGEGELPEEERQYLLSTRQKRQRRSDDTNKGKGVERRDWTYRESIWGSADTRKELDKVVNEARVHLEKRATLEQVDDIAAH